MANQTANQITKAVAAAKAAVIKVNETDQDLRARHVTLTKERLAVATAPPPLAECVENSRHLVEQAAEKWANDYGGIITNAVAGGVQYSGTKESPRLPALPTFRISRTLELEDLCGLAPKLVKEHLEQAIRAAENQRFGLTAAEREKKLAEIDEELALIEEEHSGMVAAAAELGVQLALLDAVRERRETEEAEERSQWIPTVHGAVGMGGG